MNSLDTRERELVALGAALGSNCVPCIEYHLPLAKEAGLSDAQISEALRLADELRQVPARRVLEAALQLLAASSGDSVHDDGEAADPKSAGADSGAASGESPGAEGRCC